MDKDLVRRCARGEESAFRELVEQVEKPLIHFIVRYLGDRSSAEDVLQETFVRVLRNIADFEPHASLNTWIFTIARNLCLDRLKAKRRHREVSMDAPQRSDGGKVIDFRDMLQERRVGPDAEAVGAEMGERVKKALGKVGAQKREALILRVFVGMPYQDIAKIVRAPVGTVKFRVHEAMRELTEIMQSGEKSEGTSEAV